MNSEINAFINKYVKEIRNNNAAFFAGAGFSKESGYVDWKTLLESIALELNLEVEKEHDLVALAQYYYNKHQNRGMINDVIFEEFSKQKGPTQNHKILARLPISVIWTTNYDDLIEKAFGNVQKIVDVKSRNEHLSNTLANRECILYKMHGDKNNPNDAILIKDDYERYYKEHKQFLSALTGDLISKTFLFVGFSFQDPNLDYILSRIRVDYEENPRQHYAIMKSIDRKDKVKYLGYITGLANRYLQENKECPIIHMVVIYTGDIERKKVSTNYNIGAVRMKLETAFLSEMDSKKISTCAVAIWLGAAIKQQKYNSHILPSVL